MESSTQISFSIENAAELTLVFNPDFSGSVKINGSSYSSNNGIATISLESGDYTITKGESSNLFYISISFEKTTPIKRIVHLHNRVYFDSYANALYIPESVGITQINIVSVNGDHLKMKASGSVVDLNHLRSGVYIVRVKTDLGWIQNKIYKK
jgi:pectate lyase